VWNAQPANWWCQQRS